MLKEEDFSLFVRAYWPQDATLDGSWTRRHDRLPLRMAEPLTD